VIFLYFVSYTVRREGLGHAFGMSYLALDQEVASWADIEAMRDALMSREKIAGDPVVIISYQLLAVEPMRRPVL
jgi:hypothetical protein